MSCEHCTDPNGIPCFPQYGVGPHICFHHIPGAIIGESLMLDPSHWGNCYQEDPQNPGEGVWWCPHCGDGKPNNLNPAS